MTGVFLSKEMVATDANRLYRHKLGFKKSFILPPKAAKIILSLGGIGWDVTFDGDHAIFKNDDGIEIVTRTIDAKFPEYNVVIPRQKDMVAKMFSHSALLLAEIKNAMKFANKSTNQIKFTLNGTVSVHAADVDFQYEYENELGFAEFGFKDPAGAQSLSIAFNGKFLTEIIGKLPKDEAVEFWLWGPTKAVVINKDFLLMPLMLNE
jgi:DNA polymerase-3 subunit beta